MAEDPDLVIENLNTSYSLCEDEKDSNFSITEIPTELNASFPSAEKESDGPIYSVVQRERSDTAESRPVSSQPSPSSAKPKRPPPPSSESSTSASTVLSSSPIRPSPPPFSPPPGSLTPPPSAASSHQFYSPRDIKGSPPSRTPGGTSSREASPGRPLRAVTPQIKDEVSDADMTQLSDRREEWFNDHVENVPEKDNSFLVSILLES